MKRLSIISFVLYLLCSPNGNATETECFWKSKTPWQKMLTVLYNHGIDTAGMTVMTQVSSNILKEASDELDKKFGIKEGVIDWSACSENVRVGDAICKYMLIKYQNKSGEKYDYYKVRYSTNDYDFWSFLDKYPESRYSEELRQKKNCVEVCFLWRKMGEKTSGGDIVAMGRAFYSKSQKIESCNHEGFAPLVEDIKKYMKTVEDWDGLISKRRKIKNYDDYSAFVSFKEEHVDYLSSYQILVDDSIAQCKDNIAWKKARETNTIAAYRDYLSSCPHGEHVYEVERKIRDYEDWMDAREAGNYAAYAAYCEKYRSGDSVNVARMLMHRIEESDWQRVKDSKNWLDLQAMLDRYPSGYYSDSAMTAIKALFATPETNMNDVFYSIGNCSVTDTGVICIANNSIRKSNLRFTFTRRGRTVLQKTLQSGESHQFKLKNGSYHVVVDNPDNIRFKGLSDPYATHGDMTVSSQVYRFDYYSFPISEESLDKSTLSSKYSDRKAEDRAWAAMYSYLEKNKISVWLNTNECIKDRIYFLYTDGYNINNKYKDVFLSGDALKEKKKVFADEILTKGYLEILGEYRIPVRVVMFNSVTQTNDVFEYSVAELKHLKAKKQKK